MAASLVAIAHRSVWQRLPRSFRRSMAFSLAGLLAPGRSGGEPNGGPVVVVGALGTASGLGESARLCHDALKALGVPVYGIDISARLMQPADIVNFEFADGRAIEGPATLIVHVNGPLMPLAMLALPRRLVARSRVIGYWAWELPTLPADWQRGKRFVHEVWVPSTFTAEAVAPMLADVPVRIVPHPIAIRPVPRRGRRRDPDQPFVALTMLNMTSSYVRKNPAAAIGAFKQAFGDDPDARLIVKCTGIDAFADGARALRALCPAGGNVVLSEAMLDQAGLEALYGEADAVISLHRSEGFGLVVAEAMLRGIPVVATDWSGSSDFLTAATGMPVGCDFVPAADPQHTYDFADSVWAAPRIDEAARALQMLRSDPAAAAVIGERAAAFAATAFSAQAYGAAFGPVRHLGSQ